MLPDYSIMATGRMVNATTMEFSSILRESATKVNGSEAFDMERVEWNTSKEAFTMDTGRKAT